jgi:hypothetical protein
MRSTPSRSLKGEQILKPRLKPFRNVLLWMLKNLNAIMVPAAGFEPATNGLQNRADMSHTVFYHAKTSGNTRLFSR